LKVKYNLNLWIHNYRLQLKQYRILKIIIMNNNNLILRKMIIKKINLVDNNKDKYFRIKETNN
jgi:hypothetical protein